MNRRNIILGAPSALALSGCFYDRRFDISWSEEIQLRDGRILVAHITRTMERMEQSIFRYGGRIFDRDTALQIEIPGVGSISQFFKGFTPATIEYVAGRWYGVINGKSYYGSNLQKNQDWNYSETIDGNCPIVLDGHQWRPIPFNELPAEINHYNFIFLGFASSSEIISLDKSIITNKDKLSGKYDFGGDFAKIRKKMIRRPNI